MKQKNKWQYSVVKARLATDTSTFLLYQKFTIRKVTKLLICVTLKIC